MTIKKELTNDKPDLKDIYPNKLNINSISLNENNKSPSIFFYYLV